ncbi:outer membrane beta-barrel protein [Massilia sp. CCM 8695]|uniref:Outer membrane beta-barrel protein n=1 Tax=Massilia frigida TaxID=2609281 RepID=A0ABX0N5V1_9BURK|nr:OmpW family outer membrane protein [Massilia frigida]NHZ80442.1 outer membrane beta-barrel protein [Massilia frigida]
MKSKLLAVAVSMLGLIAVDAQAQDGPWLVRARAAHLNPADKATPVGGAGASDRISVSDKTIPEVDVSYFFTPNFAAELVLTYPQKHEVMLDGAKIGTFKHLPPSVLGQYHFNPIGQFKPYLGAGINYTRMSQVKLLDGAGGLENHSVGLALQTGLDFRIDKNWSLNLDIKRITIRSDVMISGAKVSTVKIDPVLIAVGAGYRF